MGDSPKWVKSKNRRKITPGTAGGPGGRDQTLAMKRRKNARKSVFFVKNLKINFFFFIYLLVMAKYWGKQIFTHRSFPEVGQMQKTEREKKERRKTERW